MLVTFFVVYPSVCFVAIASIALIYLCIAEAPGVFLLQREIEEGFGLLDISVNRYIRLGSDSQA